MVTGQWGSVGENLGGNSRDKVRYIKASQLCIGVFVCFFYFAFVCIYVYGEISVVSGKIEGR